MVSFMLCCFTSRERIFGTYCLGGWVGPEQVVKRKVCAPTRDWSVYPVSLLTAVLAHLWNTSLIQPEHYRGRLCLEHLRVYVENATLQKVRMTCSFESSLFSHLQNIQVWEWKLMVSTDHWYDENQRTSIKPEEPVFYNASFGVGSAEFISSFWFILFKEWFKPFKK